MDKKEYLERLRALLKGLPADEVEDIIFDYEDHFNAGVEDGKSEEEIAESLGDIKSIGKQYRVTASISNAEKNVSAANIFKAILATAGLGFFNLVFVLGPLLGLLGALFGLFAASVGMVFGGLFGFIITIFKPAIQGVIYTSGDTIFSLFISIGISSLGMLFFIGNCYIGHFVYKMIIRYLKWNLEIITRK